ncbi:MAG: FCD domain-containing protein, partial [Acidobacteriaceae bacterium]
ISQASGNPILAALMETITSALYDDRVKTVQHSVDLRESAEMHRAIYRAIRNSKPAEARKLMEQHLHMAETAQGKERTAQSKEHPTQSKERTALKSIEASGKPRKPVSKPTTRPAIKTVTKTVSKTRSPRI